MILIQCLTMYKEFILLLFSYIITLIISGVIVYNIELSDHSAYELGVLLIVAISLTIFYNVKKL